MIQLLREVFKKTTIKDQKLFNRILAVITCENCEDNGYGYWSCCTGDYLGAEMDIDLCPICKEHLGEENCEECNPERTPDQRAVIKSLT